MRGGRGGGTCLLRALVLAVDSLPAQRGPAAGPCVGVCVCVAERGPAAGRQQRERAKRHGRGRCAAPGERWGA